MKHSKPATVAEYIKSAPPAGQPHLRKLHAILKRVAPKAKGVIKWGNPFFVEPRFLFAFSAHKAHLSFAPGPEVIQAFREELKAHQTTKHFLRISYDERLPEALIRKMAQHCVKTVSERSDDGFW